MSMLIHSLGLDQLPRGERLVLVQELWDSIAAEGPPPLTDAKRRELERRVAEDDARPDDVIPWEQVKARTAARLRQSHAKGENLNAAYAQMAREEACEAAALEWSEATVSD